MLGTVVRGAAKLPFKAAALPFKGAAKVAKGSPNFALRHPGAVLGVAALAGAGAADPLKPATEAFQDVVLGDPNAIRTMGRKAFVGHLKSSLMTPSERATAQRISQYDDPPSYTDSEGTTHTMSREVNGALLFGLYNRRLGG